jgi:hypothetical protein
MSDRDSEDDEHDDLDDDEEEEESPAPPKAKAKASAGKASGSASKVSGRAPSKVVAAKPAMMPASNVIAIGVLALAIGGAIGWFGQIQKTKSALRAEAAAAPAGSGAASGPCGAWQSKICTSAGEQSASCQEAKGAADLLLPSTCEVALGTVPETLAKVKAGRVSCDKLVTKICADLSPGSKTCDMVKERTPAFPRERCDQMLQNYDKVIGELKQMDQQGGGMQMGGPQRMPPGGMRPMPPGGMPPGAMPPGGMPRITIPQQSAPQP